MVEGATMAIMGTIKLAYHRGQHFYRQLGN
jgi:hypothetical protein